MFTDLSITEIVVVVISLLLSLAFHEATHAYVAHRLGDTTARDEGRLTLNPLKHIDVYTTILLPLIMILIKLPPIFIARPVPFDPRQVRYGEYGAALVGIAGPLSNLFLAVLAGILYNAGLIGPTLQPYAQLFMAINISLFVFNMIPIPPLDGSRLLYAFAPDGLRKLMQTIESMGLIFVMVIVLLFFSVLGPIISNISRAIYNFLIF